MRDYEIVYIFRSNLSSDEIEAKLERYHSIITEGGMGEVTAVVMWGKRHLAYPIEKQTSGYYVIAQFTAQSNPLTELERVLKLEDDLLRHLMVVLEGDLPLPDSAVQRSGEDGAGDTSGVVPAEKETVEEDEQVSDDEGEVEKETVEEDEQASDDEGEVEKEIDVDEVLEDVTGEED